jgi:septal ring factor EnvC (AmiA/AmiB activator)
VKQSKLQKLLRELKEKLAEIPAAEDPTENSVEILKQDIDKALRLLEHSENGELDHESLRARLRETIDRFEVTHPTLTAIMNNIFNALSGSGV